MKHTGEFETQPAWEQDFSTMEDGPLPEGWNAEIGTGPNKDGWGNDEAEYYTDREENVRIENGTLIIEARHEQYKDRDYTSGRINTQGMFSLLYGKVEVTMKLPKGVGTWPAFWFWPDGAKYTPQDAGISAEDDDSYIVNGEIDAMEAVGAEHGTVTASVHSYEQVKYLPNANQGKTEVPDDTEEYHVYGIEKTPDKIVLTVDGVAFCTVRKPKNATPENWPFDQPYFLRLNLAMGGTYGGEKKHEFPPDGIDNASGPWILATKKIAYFPLADSKK